MFKISELFILLGYVIYLGVFVKLLFVCLFVYYPFSFLTFSLCHGCVAQVVEWGPLGLTHLLTTASLSFLVIFVGEEECAQ